MTDPIVDRHGRTFSYLRVAVIEQCNLRCVYCMPEEGVNFTPRAEQLSSEEILRIVGALAPAGVTKVRLTGGEPLLRADLVELVAELTRVPRVESVHLTTNGILLAERLAALREAGLSGVNISLDTLRADRFQQITRRAGLERVLAAIDAAVAIGIPSVKVNAVAMRGFNDDELGDFAALTRSRPITVRFIELMPFDAHQVWRTGRYLGVDRMSAALEALGAVQAPGGSSTEERSYQLPDAIGRVALIPAFSRSLCGTCDRIRLTADGKLRNCLYAEEEFDLKRLIRSGGDDRAILALVRSAMGEKLVDGWAAQERSAARSAGEPSRASMTKIGG